MIQDYFSLDKKGNDYLLLRIITKLTSKRRLSGLAIFLYPIELEFLNPSNN